MQLNNAATNLFECLPEKDQNLSPELNDYFDSLRQQGDVEADALVSDTFGQPKQKNRIAFNHLLDLTDKLAKNPELALNAETLTAQELKEYPAELVKYFSPIEAPDWVDEEKLTLSGELWQKDMLAIISVLYSISLPACYLMKNGIPALYQTAKLTSKRYIYQRIYETGIMLDAVLSPNGLDVIHDIDHSAEEHFSEAISKMDPGGQWKKSGRSMIRKATATEHMDITELENHLKCSVQTSQKSKRYIYGKGFVTAKKIRFLHATMRLMLMNPELFPAHIHAKSKKNFTEALSFVEEPYDVAKLGKPVNQEDLAYTLLTFGYCIAKGLEKIGRKWNLKEKEAFLHTWKVIGHTIGIQDNLITDKWDEAEKLFLVIQERQAGESEQAKVLTSTLLNFFEDYLPPYFGINKGIAARLILKQLGAKQTAMIMPAEYINASGGFITVILYAVSMMVFNIYFRVRRVLYKIPIVSVFFEKTFYETGLELVDSWRGVYSRKPFYIAKDANEWEIKHGVNPSFLKKLTNWRHKLFNTIGLGIGSIIISFISVLIYVYSVIIEEHKYETISGWVSIGLVAFGLYVLRYRVKKVCQSRPLIENHSHVEKAQEKANTQE
mgnify:CR=1 FL=1